MKTKYIAMAFALIVVSIIVVAGLGFDRWRGGGFSATGPEMPRLRQALSLKSGMLVADVGAGGGDLTMALRTNLTT